MYLRAKSKRKINKKVKDFHFTHAYLGSVSYNAKHEASNLLCFISNRMGQVRTLTRPLLVFRQYWLVPGVNWSDFKHAYGLCVM